MFNSNYILKDSIADNIEVWDKNGILKLGSVSTTGLLDKSRNGIIEHYEFQERFKQNMMIDYLYNSKY
jgi:hypothetical protein